MVSYGPAAAAAAVSLAEPRMTIGGIGPANAPFFKAPHRRVLSTTPSAAEALAMAVKLLPARTTWCLPQDANMARIGWTPGKCWRYRVTLIGYQGSAPAGCHGLVAWFEGPQPRQRP